MVETNIKACVVKNNSLYRKFIFLFRAVRIALDWITLVIESIGVLILLVWIVVPAKEFREIFNAIQCKNVKNVAHGTGQRRRGQSHGPHE